MKLSELNKLNKHIKEYVINIQKNNTSIYNLRLGIKYYISRPDKYKDQIVQMGMDNHIRTIDQSKPIEINLLECIFHEIY